MTIFLDKPGTLRHDVPMEAEMKDVTRLPAAETIERCRKITERCLRIASDISRRQHAKTLPEVPSAKAKESKPNV